MEFQDTLTFDGIKILNDGYLVASVKAARTGIQIYGGSEVGKPDMKEVRVYRPAAEVFNKDTLASFTSTPVTDDHPKEAVTADNWRKYAVGNTGEEVARDGETMRVSLIVKDAAAIRKIQDGKRELSCGYTCDLKWEPGRTDDGLEYDAIQTNIRGNHLAIVSRARGGPELTIGDSDVTLKMITVDGHQVEVSDAAAIAISGLQGKLTAADAKVATLTTDMAAKDTKIAELTTKVATADAEIVTLKKAVEDAKVTPQKLRDAAKSYATTLDVAKKIAPKAAISDTMDEPAIKKAVVSAKLGDAAKDWSPEQVAISFDTLKAALPAANQQRDAAREIPRTTDGATVTESKAAWQEMVDSLTNPETKKAS